MTKFPKRICLLADSHGLYDDRIYWKEALSLKKRGYDVHYVLYADKNETGLTSEGIRYYKLKKRQFHKNLYINFVIKSFLPFSIYSKMLKIAASIKADAYHIHDLKVNRIGKKLKKLPWKPKVIYDVHEPYPENIMDYHETKGLFSVLKNRYAEYIRKWEKNCSLHYDLIITTEENLRDRFREFLPFDRVQVIYNYTNLTDDGNISTDKKSWDAIYAGGITERRGAMKIITATYLATKEKSDIKVLFLGTYFPPELKNEMLEFIREHAIENNVDLLDNVPYHEVANYYRKSRIGLGIFLPIPTHRIILQIKIFEYLSFGLPIIGSNFGHISRIIQEDHAGITVNPDKESEIAYALVTLLKNKNLYNELSTNALNASGKYQWKFMEERFLSLYGDLFSDKTE